MPRVSQVLQIWLQLEYQFTGNGRREGNNFAQLYLVCACRHCLSEQVKENIVTTIRYVHASILRRERASPPSRERVNVAPNLKNPAGDALMGNLLCLFAKEILNSLLLNREHIVPLNSHTDS